LAGINVGAPARPLPSADFGLIGLAVMGQNLILNVADHGFTVCAYNRTTAKVDRFLANEAKGELLTTSCEVNYNETSIDRTPY
jgi:6-phosphogluconate dehydrogenase